MIATPFSRPLFVMAKPVGAQCNLRCDYCYYLDKKLLYPEGQVMQMTDDTLERFVRQYIEAQTQREVMFIWHGGEPLLRGKDFYRKVLRLQSRYGGGRLIDNCIQTNATLIDDEWCELFRENGFLVGVSIDGPQEFHDKHRKASGKLDVRGSFDRVMHGINLLNKHSVEWNAMAVINSTNVQHPLEFYRFFKSIGCRFIQFEPLVVPFSDNSISGEEWGDFLCRMFDEWRAHDVGEIFVQYFECMLANWAGVTPSLCSLAPVCGQSAALEHNGDLYSCDHFVFPQYKLGNIHRDTITAMMYSPQQHQFGQSKYTSLPRQCRECQWLRLCHGECPKNRIATDRYGNPGLNYLCQGFQRFFTHTAAFAKDFLNKRNP